jgi:hypothetical protein
MTQNLLRRFEHFIIHLFCNPSCENQWSLNESYFGNANLENVNIHNIPPTIEDYDLIPRDQISNYLINSWTFFVKNSDSLAKKIFTCRMFCHRSFFVALRSIRENNYKNTSSYSKVLISLHERFSKYDNYLADMVLNVMRYDTDKSTQSFLFGKKFQSKEFNSVQYLDWFKNDKNAILDYKQLVR